MRSLFTIIFMTISISAQAAVNYQGVTKAGDVCSVNFNLENNNVSFFSKGVGFGFTVSESEIFESLLNGNNPVVINGNDGPVSASLSLYFLQGTLDSAVYRQRTFLLPKKVECLNLEVTEL